MARNSRTTRSLSGQRKAEAAKAKKDLTPKQEEVVALAHQGLTVAQAAEKLGVAESGVYNHAKRIREKGHEIEFAKSNGHPAAAAAPTNGGGVADDNLTDVAKKALATDAGAYVEALDQVIEECGARKAEIGETIGALQEEDQALSERMKELSVKKQSAVNVQEQIAALA